MLLKTTDSLLLDNLLQWDFAKQKNQKGTLLVCLLLAFCLQINYSIFRSYCLIDLPWFWESWNLLAVISSLLINCSMFGMLLFVTYERYFIRSTLKRFCLGVLEGVAQRQDWDTMSGSWKRKVSRRLMTKFLMIVSTAHARSSADILS